MDQLNTHVPALRRVVAALVACLALAIVALLFFGLQAYTARAGPNDIGLVLEPGGPNDHGFNELSVQGLLRAESELGVNGTVYPTTSSADYQAAFSQCVSDGNALCFGVGYTQFQAISITASLNPGVNFALLDFEWSDPKPNLRGINFNVEEAAYLAGVLAGRMTDENKIGAIGGLPLPPVDRFIDGYWYGARCANPAVTTWITYTYSFQDPSQGDEVARYMINHGADVIDGVAGPTGNGALLAAAELGKWAIGVDVDEYYTTFMSGGATGSDRLLTSVLKRVDNALYQTIQDQLAGYFSGGNVWLSLAEDGVGLAPFHEADPYIPVSVRNEITATRQAIISGALDVYGPCSSDYEYQFTDYFDHPSLTRGAGGLQPLWQWIREDSDFWSLDHRPGFMRIRTQEGGVAGSGSGQRNLLMAPAPPGNYRVTTRLTINPSQNFQYGGLMVYVDDDNYVQINRAYVLGGTLNFDLEIGGVFTNTQIAFTDNDVFLRIVKHGNRYTGQYSLDGLSWTTMGEHTANFEESMVGLGAANNLGGLPSIDADFAFFRLEGNLPVLYTAFSDAFDSTSLNPAWSWLNENPAHWSLNDQPGYLRIDMHPGNIGSENLLYRNPPEGTYDVRTRLIFNPSDNFQIAGIPVFLDYDNHLILGRAYCQTGGGNCVDNGVYFDNLQGGTNIGNFATAVHETGLAHLRLFRSGAHYFGFYSADGVHWRYIGMHTFTPSGPDLKLGLAVGQDFAGATLLADFDNFLLKADQEELLLPVILRHQPNP